MSRHVTAGTNGLEARVAFRCTTEQKQKLVALGGGAWIRAQLNAARKPRSSKKS